MISVPRLLGMAILYCCLTACTPDHPVAIRFGKDQCDYCRMSIANPQYGSELITDKGRVLKFDAAECMANQLVEEPITYQKLYAVPYDMPKALKPVSSLTFVIDPQFRSPMGANLAAFSVAENVPVGVEKLSWEDLIKKLSE